MLNVRVVLQPAHRYWFTVHAGYTYLRTTRNLFQTLEEFLTARTARLMEVFLSETVVSHVWMIMRNNPAQADLLTIWPCNPQLYNTSVMQVLSGALDSPDLPQILQERIGLPLSARKLAGIYSLSMQVQQLTIRIKTSKILQLFCYPEYTPLEFSNQNMHDINTPFHRSGNKWTNATQK